MPYGHFRQGSKEQGSIKSSVPIGQEVYIGRWSLDKGPGPKQIKLWFSLHGIILERRKINWFITKKEKSLKESSWFGEPKCCSISLLFLLFSNVFFYTCYSKFVKMEDMLWTEDIVDSAPAHPFLTNFRVDMVNFMNSRIMMVAQRGPFSAFPSARNGGEKEKEIVKKLIN